MSGPFRPRPVYQSYVLVVLLLVYVLNFIDRQVLALVQEDIKLDLGLSDAEIGSLSTAFAIFYTIAGIPIARLADMTSRRGVLAASVAVWSVLTAASGVVTSYVQMAIARFGVAIGEAGGTPPSHALISDYFSPERRATAMSFYGWGIYLGTFLGFAGGGAVVAASDWRTAFFVAGGIGLPLVLLLFTVKEPPAGASESTAPIGDAPPVLSVLGDLARNASFRSLMMAAMCQAFLGYTVLGWGVSFLRRLFDMDVAEAGFAFGAAALIGGALGITTGGYLADRLSRKDRRWYGWICAASSFAAFPFALWFAWAGNAEVAIVVFTVFYFLNNAYVSILWTLVQNLVQPQSRATASATQMSVLNIAGMGLGPLTAGLVSDYLEPTQGDEALRTAMTIAAVIGAASGLFFLRMNRTLRADLARVTTGDAA